MSNENIQPQSIENEIKARILLKNDDPPVTYQELFNVLNKITDQLQKQNELLATLSMLLKK